MTRRERALRIACSLLLGLALFGAGFVTGSRVERANAGGWESLLNLVNEAKKLNTTIKDLDQNIEKLKQNSKDLREMRDRFDPKHKGEAK